jgi:hypothetical protein
MKKFKCPENVCEGRAAYRKRSKPRSRNIIVLSAFVCTPKFKNSQAG